MAEVHDVWDVRRTVESKNEVRHSCRHSYHPAEGHIVNHAITECGKTTGNMEPSNEGRLCKTCQHRVSKRAEVNRWLLDDYDSPNPFQ